MSWAPWRASGPSSAPTGRAAFRAVLTDNGAEFSDERAIVALIGEGRRRGCSTADPRRSDQKGRPRAKPRRDKAAGLGGRRAQVRTGFAPADLALAMSHVNPSSRGALG